MTANRSVRPHPGRYVAPKFGSHASNPSDLALRQAGLPLGEVLGRVPAPVRFVVSLNLGSAPTCAPLLSRRAACGALRFKLDATSEWGDELLECLAASGCVEAIDFKGVYQGTLSAVQGTLSAVRTDADLYRRVAEALPDAWLEDPDLSDPAARAALCSQRHRVTWDAPIHRAGDIAAQPWAARTVNVKPSRFGTLRALFDTYDHCAAPAASVSTVAGSTNWGRDAARLNTWRRCFTPTRPTTSRPPGSMTPYRHPRCRVPR